MIIKKTTYHFIGFCIGLLIFVSCGTKKSIKNEPDKTYLP